MLPMQVALIPLFTIFNKMGLINTYPAIILPQIAFSLSYSIQLFYSFSKFFPEEMLEAAIIDGCSPIGCFFKMVVPMSLNSIIGLEKESVNRKTRCCLELKSSILLE